MDSVISNSDIHRLIRFADERREDEELLEKAYFIILMISLKRHPHPERGMEITPELRKYCTDNVLSMLNQAGIEKVSHQTGSDLRTRGTTDFLAIKKVKSGEGSESRL